MYSALQQNGKRLYELAREVKTHARAQQNNKRLFHFALLVSLKFICASSARSVKAHVTARSSFRVRFGRMSVYTN
jgi:tRNA U55 pseudouridine synthase TruB